MLPKWQKHLPHKFHSQPHQLKWKLLVMAKHGELFESKILIYVQPLITRLCLLHVHKHGLIIHNRFITINQWSAVHYDILLQRTSLQWYIVLLCNISLQRSLARTISQRDIAKIVPISRWFIILTFSNPCHVSLIYRQEITRTKRNIRQLSFVLPGLDFGKKTLGPAVS